MRKNQSRVATARMPAQRSGEVAVEDLTQHLKAYAAENPGTCALWCFIAGFILGWRLKPW